MRNLLLAGLPPVSRERLEPIAETVAIKARQVLHPNDKPLKHAILPCGALLSVVMRSNGKAVEVAMIGEEGFFGLPLFFGSDDCPMAAVAQVSGHAIRLRACDFQRAIRADQAFSAVLGLYAQAFSVMIAQTVVCFSAHRVEQRCAKWLLMAHDRLRTDQFPLTQEFLAQMLGARRSTLSEVAERMRRDHLIGYRQGRMTILDRGGLEDLACACYAVIGREFARMFQSRPPDRLVR